MGCHFLPQEIFSTQGLNPRLLLHLLHCRQSLYRWATREALYYDLNVVLPFTFRLLIHLEFIIEQAFLPSLSCHVPLSDIKCPCICIFFSCSLYAASLVCLSISMLISHCFYYCCSVAKPCPILWDPMDNSTLGFPFLHNLLEFAQTHVHWISDTIQPSHLRDPLLLPSIFPSIRVFSNELALHIKCLKYWGFSFSISPSKEY